MQATKTPNPMNSATTVIVNQKNQDLRSDDSVESLSAILNCSRRCDHNFRSPSPIAQGWRPGVVRRIFACAVDSANRFGEEDVLALVTLQISFKGVSIR